MKDHPEIQSVSGTNTDLAALRFNQKHYVSSRRSLVDSGGVEIRLRAKTCQVFELLASHSNEVVSRDHLINTVWGEVFVTDDSLNQSIREIRKALGDSERKILETLPRHGYLLHATRTPSAAAASTVRVSKNQHRKVIATAVAASLLAIAGVYALKSNLTNTADLTSSAELLKAGDDQSQLSEGASRDNLTVWVNTTGKIEGEAQERLRRSVITGLSRYSNIYPTPVNTAKTDYELELSWLDDNDGLINVQLHHSATEDLVVAENLMNTDSGNITGLSSRIAALVGSPAGGAIGHHLMKVSRAKPVAQLTRPECLAHGYGCTSCSGEFDTITPRAVQCLANLLKNNPQDPDAWALQSTVYSRQYLWGSALQEPMRSDKSKRGHLVSKAVEAATRAEALADGNNPSVYWGMVQAYLASCDVEKMQVAVDRGLQINPDDPSMLAVYGNFLSYPGGWDEGKSLIEKALNKEPRFFKKWWYMALAKWHYRRGEYQQAYDLFNQSFNERNWLSHLQLAYTLPHLGRIDEAKKALQGFMRVAPSMTREHVYEFYKSYCFDDEFLSRVKDAFDLIDMPSRGSGDDFKNIQPVRASVEKIGDRMVEYVDVGKGVPVVFVHGAISDFRTWGYMLLPMSERYRFLSLTLRYFGTQDWPEGKHQFDLNVDVQDIIDFIQHKQLGSVYLVGWSRSGAITSALARERPDLVRGVINYEPTTYELLDQKNNPDAPPESLWPDFAEVGELVQKGDLEGAVVAAFEGALERNPGEFQTEPTMLQRVVLDSARTEALDYQGYAPDQPYVDCGYIGKITVPGLILYGENTNIPWQFISKRYADCLPDSQIVAVENANHDGPLSQPEQVSYYIDEFIKTTESAN